MVMIYHIYLEKEDKSRKYIINVVLTNMNRKNNEYHNKVMETILIILYIYR